MPPTKHARLSASSAHRWMNCAGSIRMSVGLPEIETFYQIEGRAAHAVAEHWLRHGACPEYMVMPDGTDYLDDVMREAVGLFVDTVHALHAKYNGRLFIERTFDLASLRPPEPMFGTADAVIVADRILIVIDLKYGSGVVVEVHDNVQLLYYALGAVLAELIRRVMDPKDTFVVEDNESILDAALRLFDTIIITIVQPRAPHTDGPVRSSIELSPADLRAFATKLMERAHATQAPDAPLTAGSWCQFCPARGHCPELAAHAKLVAQTDFEAVPMEAPPDVEHLPIERVAEMLKSVEVVEMFVRAMYERVTRELEQGREVPGWKLVMKRPRRVWTSAEELEKWGRSVFGKEFELTMYQRELLSPAQVEKIVGRANLPPELYSRVSSGLTLVPDSDPRPAAAVGPAEDFLALPPGSVEPEEA